ARSAAVISAAGRSGSGMVLALWRPSWHRSHSNLTTSSAPCLGFGAVGAGPAEPDAEGAADAMGAAVSGPAEEDGCPPLHAAVPASALTLASRIQPKIDF